MMKLPMFNVKQYSNEQKYNHKGKTNIRTVYKVKRRKVDAYSINNTSDIESTIELGYACTSAGDNGAINVWKDDAGIIRGELMRYCVTVEKRTFTSYAEVEKCVSDWLERINP